jgi:hypothetical protein
MNTLGQAYKVAVELHHTLGDEAPHVASERAQSFRRSGDEPEAVHWDRVTAFLTKLVDDKTAH